MRLVRVFARPTDAGRWQSVPVASGSGDRERRCMADPDTATERVSEKVPVDPYLTSDPFPLPTSSGSMSTGLLIYR